MAGRPRRLVMLAVLLLGLMGVAMVVIGPSTNQWLLVAGVLGVIAAPTVWLVLRIGRWLAVGAALFALLPGIHGLVALGVVAQERMACEAGRVASIAMNSYPEGYCGMVDWTQEFAIGFALLAVGIAGLVVLAIVIREPEHFRKPLPRFA